jgi:hypothetical protein
LGLLGTVGVGKLPAGLGAVVVNGASVVIGQKRTGKLLQHRIPVFVYPQVRFHKGRGFHAHFLGNPFDVFVYPERACGFAALGAVHAVDFAKGLLVQPVNYGI